MDTGSLNDKKKEYVWYFAYGSNLDLGQMMNRVGKWIGTKRAVAKRYKLVFNVKSERWDGLTANLVETDNIDDKVYGVVYRILKQKLDVLTQYEGVEPVDILVETDGVHITAKTYVFGPTRRGGRPPDSYLEMILGGLRQHGYSEQVIEEVKKLAESRTKETKQFIRDIADCIAECQLKWAAQRKISCEGSYTKKVEDNIFNHELYPDTRTEYERGKGHELEGKRAHMKALHSSSALVVNVFDYWRRQNRVQDIARGCGAEGIISGMEFEKIHPIKGVARTPPHLDIEFAGPMPLAIESKFTETYHRQTRRDNKDTHLDKYLKHRDIWNGISKVRALAESIVRQSGVRTDFEYLDVPQLIKHFLGLKGSYGGSFCLLYLWYKVNSPEASRHEEELARFSTSIKDEINFRAMTYQDLFNRIRHLPDVDSAYVEYLEQRYFPTSS